MFGSVCNTKRRRPTSNQISREKRSFASHITTAVLSPGSRIPPPTIIVDDAAFVACDVMSARTGESEIVCDSPRSGCCADAVAATAVHLSRTRVQLNIVVLLSSVRRLIAEPRKLQYSYYTIIIII